MHLYKTLLAAVTLLLSASAAGYEAEQASGWRGPGFYTIASRATGTVVDLYLGGREDGTPVYGWRPGVGNNHQIWLISKVNTNEYVILNNGTSTAISASPAKNPVVGKAFNVHDRNVRWALTTQSGSVTFESLTYPGNVLDLAKGESGDKVPILNYPRHDGSNQQWLLNRLDGAATSEHQSFTINVEL